MVAMNERLVLREPQVASEKEVVAMISDKDYAYTLRPAKVMKTAEFMAKVGTIHQAPAAIEDMFFPEAAGLGGD